MFFLEKYSKLHKNEMKVLVLRIDKILKMNNYS